MADCSDNSVSLPFPLCVLFGVRRLFVWFRETWAVCVCCMVSAIKAGHFCFESHSSHFCVDCPAGRAKKKIWLIAESWCAQDKTKSFICVKWTDPFIRLNSFNISTVCPELLSGCFSRVPITERKRTSFIKTINESSRRRWLWCGLAEPKDFLYGQHLLGGRSAPPKRESPLSLFWKQHSAQMSQQQLVTCACFSYWPVNLILLKNPDGHGHGRAWSRLSLSLQM